MKPTYVLTRIGGGLVVLWLVSLLTFALLQLVPGDAAQLVAGDNASPERVEEIRRQLGLDQPLITQYLSWLGGILHGDLGNSVFTGDPVTAAILRAAPATLSITLVALIIAVAIGVPAGIVAGLRQGGWIDRAVSLLATVGIAMPGFWVGMLLILLFALTNPWLPATGYAPISDGIGTWLSHIIIPATALGLATGAELARHARGCVADVLERPYIRTARARGAGSFWLIRHHVLRNAAIPVVTVLGLQAGRLLGGSIVIEMVCGVDGLGTLAINSILQRDLPILQGYVLLAAAVVVVVNLVVDGVYGWLNPKVRTS
ncbi:peptide/nickel transport system permease protein [Pseudonocardia thermophila]|jgi:ABC-type dipeptide/oligopeptide/nickel transport systems, permease components|uniref:Peptide/nickel transport system permease protein n=1 Tax=Pseudonocardia thermophila TaxID=1848 RepID=A0A1M6T1R9_PSETH|nr:ABC transporter permease [Pseudonocardia thermophila]SHK50871.1 peptide/nickel transport system permease protein [Pseudonocardia thermophila]